MFGVLSATAAAVDLDHHGGDVRPLPPWQLAVAIDPRSASDLRCKALTGVACSALANIVPHEDVPVDCDCLTLTVDCCSDSDYDSDSDCQLLLLLLLLLLLMLLLLLVHCCC